MHEVTNSFVPTNYMPLEKLQSAGMVAHWDKTDCIQCTLCATSCAHSAIRPFSLVEKSDRPATFETLPYTGKPGKEFTIQVSPADCRGCTVCTKVCPKKCITMKPLSEEIEAHQDNFEWARDHLYTTETHEINGHTANFKDLMQRPHYMEFMGSCPGCPETTILKLLTQITGEAA